MPLSRLVAAAVGAAFLLIGLIGFVPALGGSYNLDANNLLGLFPVNVTHNLVHMAIGVAGIAAYTQGVPLSRLFAQTVGLAYAILALVGITVAGSGNFLGLVPIGGFDIVLHTVTAMFLIYVGFSNAPLRNSASA